MTIELNAAPAAGTREAGWAAITRGMLAATAALLLASGCANRDSIVVGAVPDDYRTNHPIVISEREKIIDIPVGVSEHRASNTQRVALEGFIANYDRSAGTTVTILVPSGSANAYAASAVAADFTQILRRNGIPEGRIIRRPYQAGASEQAAPIRVSYLTMAASAGPCGRWTGDLLDNPENRHYTNFGCAYQANLAAQVANPADFLGPRRSGEIDATKRSLAIDIYQTTPGEWNPVTDY